MDALLRGSLKHCALQLHNIRRTMHWAIIITAHRIPISSEQTGDSACSLTTQ
jgi:hypothetical protein